MSVNNVTLIGNVTDDTECKQTENGKSVGSVGIAMNETRINKDTGIKKEKVEFANLVMWGKLAETFENYVKKGQKIYIEGKLQTRTWEAQDGTKRYKTEVVVRKMEFAGGGLKQKEGDVKKVTKSKGENIKRNDDINIEDVPF